MRLMVAIPTHDYAHYEFTKSLMAMVRHLDAEGIDFDVNFLGGTLVYMGREKLATEAIAKGYTHVLWLDADMTFPEDLFDQLYASGKPIITGVYHSRHVPYSSCMFSSLNPPIHVERYPYDVFEIEGCGFGCILTEVKVLYDVYREFQQAFQPTPAYGEDLSFCDRARKVGYSIYCDPRIACGHIGQLVIQPDMHNRGKKDDGRDETGAGSVHDG